MRSCTVVTAAATLFAGFAVVAAVPLSESPSLTTREAWSDLFARNAYDLLDRENLDLLERDVGEFTIGMSSLSKRTEPSTPTRGKGKRGDMTSGSTSSSKRTNPAALREQIRQILGTLTPREQKVIEMRFGLNGGRERTLEEVGQQFGVTRERVRQIEAKALSKLRGAITSSPPASPKDSRPSTPTKGKGKRSNMTSSSTSLSKRTAALREQIRQILGTLTPREQQVIEMRFGLKDGHERTLEEVGRAFGVTRESVRQIETKALSKLRGKGK